VQTGSKVIATEFTLPQGLPTGTYSLFAVANGNPSVPQTFTYSPPPIPSGLTALSGSNAFVKVSWNASSGATAYNLKRATSSTGYYTNLAMLTGLAYTNTGLTNGLTYYYKVAAIGSSGPSSDSAAVNATPAGQPIIPGATSVSLASAYNRTGIVTDGRTFSTGFDGGGSAYSANLLGPSVAWNNLIFTFGPVNASDVVSCTGQTITLSAGRFNSLQILGAGVNGSQQAQTFTVTYTDNSTATFTQSFSDWANPQSYPGEFTVVSKMPYRDQSNGGTQTLNMAVFGYEFTLDQTKTVKSIALPANANLVLMCIMLANDPVQATLANFYNRPGIYTDGTTYTNPLTGGIDGGGYSYSGTLLGNSQMWSNILFAFGPLNATNVISCSNQTIPLPPGNYSQLRMLGTGVQGNQASQSFVVTYSDTSSTTFIQGMSDWFTPQNYSGETKVVPMSYRNNTNGTSSENSTLYLYGYFFNLNAAKTVQSIRLPNDGNAIVLAISVVPDWPPTFKLNPFTLANATAGQAYSGTIATNAGDLNGDTMTFSKVSGPAWLNVAGNGILSGTPLSPNAGSNSFVVQVADPGGLSSTATMNIQVIPAQPIVLSTIAQSGSMTLNWSGGIAPYQVHVATDLTIQDWQNYGPPTNATSVMVPSTNNAAYFQVSGN
ncbi:MAG TPA: putative Ig domain-containing protein, partial [Verrucomicrobiae bacterium]|nr:putative Ig domain-containing protein [Verrucomicrobiae bacterium]